MKTIVDMSGKKQSYDGCMACAINNNELKPAGGIIFENKDFVVCQDFEVPIEGFIIISTKRHVCSINEFSESEKIEFINLVDRVLKKLKNIEVAKEFILLQGERSDVHFHISLFPRQKWMSEKFGRIVSSMKQIQEYAKVNMKTPENIAKIYKTCEILKKELNKNEQSF